MPWPSLGAPAVDRDTMVWDGTMWVPRHLKPTELGYVADIDGWHKVGGAGEPAFGTGWADSGFGYYGAYFHKYPDGTVKLIGNVTNVNWATQTLIYTLPVGYRPPKTFWATVAINVGVGLVYVDTDGSVVLNNALIYGTGATGQYVVLDHVEFPTT